MFKIVRVDKDCQGDSMQIERRVLNGITDVVLESANCDTEDEIICAASDADVIVTHEAKITRKVLGMLPKCRAVVRFLGPRISVVELVSGTLCEPPLKLPLSVYNTLSGRRAFQLFSQPAQPFALRRQAIQSRFVPEFDKADKCGLSSAAFQGVHVSFATSAFGAVCVSDNSKHFQTSDRRQTH
jgi:hypothetical protein